MCDIVCFTSENSNHWFGTYCINFRNVVVGYILILTGSSVFSVHKCSTLDPPEDWHFSAAKILSR